MEEEIDEDDDFNDNTKLKKPRGLDATFPLS